MKISLQLKLGQQLTMTPQLQQAIRLLQLSTLDLQNEIHEALESNPMLELDESQEAPESTNDSYEERELAFDKATAKATEDTSEDSSDSKWEDSIPEQLSVDTHWDDIYQSTYTTGGPASDSDDNDFESRDSASETLQDHLSWQLNLTNMSDIDRLIGMAIIDAIDANGQLSVSVQSILEGLQGELEVDEDEVIAVLHRIQQFDPVGVAYRDLSECLSIQLQQIPVAARTEAIEHALVLVKDHLDLLGSRDYAQIMRLARLKEHELRDAIAIIEKLNPRPGADIAPANTNYVIPDVIVTKDKRSGRWQVELNPETAPRLRINADYAALVKRSENSADNNYLRDNLQEARWFLKSLQSRNETLLKVASRIVEHQQGFLEHGEEAMKPLVLHDIAEAVEMHESTISRVTTQKYMHTPRGIFELKYFFSSHVSTAAGGECSSTAIRALIKKLVASENTRKPLSDSKIAKLLEEQGINVARRTIAKYRESLAIPPSNERKRLD
ncbi:RNA polymerase factor sigma-54 [Pseudohongiella spirulinae]|uniref:RNA polymerase sigma-54 factor n=1 Tax=Pseudohongiella spirulinae TaxID=1249552 RepID=A0A0S2KFA1_9GAMM|nr:RNA polymerase factor sigma-54 [Pseudohongiella spirulinae]ALO46970.1 RNA polymerase factor sigma-54 [Pseudohongiella spirulinae]